MEPTQTPTPNINTIPESPVITPKPSGKIWKIITVIIATGLVTFSLLAWYGFYLEKNDNSKKTNMENLKIQMNVGNDYFIGTTEEQNKNIDALVSDNSKVDSVYLYVAANTAYALERPKDAMFLLYAAQLRKSFDYTRFGLGEADGNNIETYLGYLNQGAGQDINPLAIQHPELFSVAVRMIEKWNVVPANDANYSEDEYGKVQVEEGKWQDIADAKKKSFLEEFAYKQEKVLTNPKGLEASRFIVDYNSGKIPQGSENDAKYGEYMKVYAELSGK